MNKDQLKSLDSLSKHKLLLDDYKRLHRTTTITTSRTKEQINDVVKQDFQFIRDDDDEEDEEKGEEENEEIAWRKRISKAYYDKLYKEYAIIDLSRYKTNEIGLRWRTENEVINGRGQFTCANRRCEITDNLKSFEVPFTYVENSIEKSALVKVVLCKECSIKLNHTNIKKKKKELKKLLKEMERKKRKEMIDKNKKKKRLRDESDESSDLFEGETKTKRIKGEETLHKESIFEGLFPEMVKKAEG